MDDQQIIRGQQYKRNQKDYQSDDYFLHGKLKLEIDKSFAFERV